MRRFDSYKVFVVQGSKYSLIREAHYAYQQMIRVQVDLGQCGVGCGCRKKMQSLAVTMRQAYLYISDNDNLK